MLHHGRGRSGADCCGGGGGNLWDGTLFVTNALTSASASRASASATDNAGPGVNDSYYSYGPRSRRCHLLLYQHHHALGSNIEVSE
jgi:hypothetical protein